ncbi:hypothetical protein NC653_036311 [Populus alba x Populus x berolinensis]|uniref:Glutaredoxin domain-containing protein n=2 Tax=Populus TaxID=3689 RepID=A0A4U5NMV6_POPAL|nr:hypothetical protein NC653_036311 [Populus alba x Populus x berolinensis]TKR83983.1 hypothetical protein D5086_0000260160 [Populus alba]
MKSVKGRFLKKLNFIPSISTLKQGLVSHLNSSENFSDQNLQIPPVYIQKDHKKDSLAICPEAPVSTDINVEQHTGNEAEKEIEGHPSLSDFEEKSLPGGSQAVILYTTSLRSIRKTFEDCHAIRFLLESFKVIFHERDVSLHLEFREELWRIMGGRVIPPRLFIKGRYIGGADEVTGLHEQGKLKNLLAGIPLNLSNCPCTGCGNIRFIVCSDCNGSRKVFADDQNDETYIRCPECNENGLVKCLICS